MTAGFYCYLYIREQDGTFPKGTPYYVGKGKGKRVFSKNHRVKPPKDRANILIVPMTLEDEAFEYEMQIIEMFGRIDQGTGCLRNLNSGGTGGDHFTGRQHTDETRKKISASHSTEKNLAIHREVGCINGRKNAENGHIQALGRVHGPRAILVAQAALTSELRSKGGTTSGNMNVESGHIQELGHSQGKKNAANKFWERLTFEQRSAGGRIGGKIGNKEGKRRSGLQAVENKTGIHAPGFRHFVDPTANHKRWHVNRGIVNPQCKFCEAA